MAEGNGTQRDLGRLETAVELLEKRFDRFEEKHDDRFAALEQANAEILAAVNQGKGGWKAMTILGAAAGGAVSAALAWFGAKP